MKLKGVLTISAIYQAMIALGMMLVPRQFGIDAVPVNASPALIAFLRIFGGPMAGIAVLNWMARKLEPSPALKAIVLGNIVGFGCITILDILSVFNGSARPVAKVFLIIHLALTIAFVVAWRPKLRQQEHSPSR
jgi:hypothetical protein